MSALQTDQLQIDWLRQGDPVVRFQTLRDLTSAKPELLEAEQKKILKAGWGRRMIDLQEDDGGWNCEKPNGAHLQCC